jgi:hypothetical protein
MLRLLDERDQVQPLGKAQHHHVLGSVSSLSLLVLPVKCNVIWARQSGSAIPQSCCRFDTLFPSEMVRESALLLTTAAGRFRWTTSFFHRDVPSGIVSI